MFLSKQHVVTALLSVCLALLYTEVDPETWVAEEKAVFSLGPRELFKFVTNEKELPEWFPLFSRISSTDEDVSLSLGKHFITETDFFMVNYTMTFEVTALESRPISKIVLESFDSILRPVVLAETSASQNGRSQLTVRVHYNRKSAWFQFTAAPCLQFLTKQHLRHGFFVLKWLLPPMT